MTKAAVSVRRAALAAAFALAVGSALVVGGVGPASAVTTGDGSLVYAPPDGSSFNDEGGSATGTAYAKIVALKHSGASNGTLISTFDDGRLIKDQSPGTATSDTQACVANPSLPCHQEFPIFQSTDGGASWQKIAGVNPAISFPGVVGQESTTRLSRTSEPFLYELPQTVGSLAAGTLLLTGQIRPSDRSNSASVTKLVVWKSTDQGATWAYLSTVDTGGPAVYDPSANSTTTAIWEPSVAVDGNGGLVTYFSDERQKANHVLQAVSYRRSTDGGLTWGTESNVAAPTNQNDRPGMITVDRLGDGTYIATFELVNALGSYGPNASPIFYKTSPDGLNWGNTASIGTAIKTADGRSIGSSPFVKWIPSGGPKGMVVVASKWGLNTSGNIDQGQDFMVNYNLGIGPWERLPFAVTFNGPSSITGFSQGVDYSPDGRTLYQATNVDHYRPSYLYNDIRVGTVPLNGINYEAEKASLQNVSLVQQGDASNGTKVGNINASNSTVTFSVPASQAGTYTVNVRYDNGTSTTSTHAVTVNGSAAGTISYPTTGDWGRFLWAQTTVSLNAGANTIRFGYQSGYAELDQIQVYRPSVDIDPEFQLINKNSGKLLEITSASTANGAGAGQWGPTGNPTQIWGLHPTGSGYTQLLNKNSGKLLEIPSAQTANGVQAGQWGPTGNATQDWTLTVTSDGSWQITNRNSGKYLEVTSAATTDGAPVGQWSATGNSCQNWRLVKEGSQ